MSGQVGRPEAVAVLLGAELDEDEEEDDEEEPEVLAVFADLADADEPQAEAARARVASITAGARRLLRCRQLIVSIQLRCHASRREWAIPPLW